MKVPLLPLDERKTTFKEVEVGFTQEEAQKEANRCLQCKDPRCVKGCPAGVNIPLFIKLFREGKIDESAEVIRESEFFPSICGRICQHEKQCEGSCILSKAKEGAVCIGGIERYIGDHSKMPKQEKKNGKNVAIIGSGPSGLTTAAVLSLAGVNAVVMEGTNTFGGVIKYGVPEFRLPKEVVAREIAGLHDLGIDFEPNAKIDADSLEEMSKKYDAVFVGTGVGKPRLLTSEGSQLKGVLSAMKFLVNLNQSGIVTISPGEKVVVVGAGYVGIDAARSAVRLGGKVTCITKATREDAMKSVTEKDYVEAEEEGVKFMFGVSVDRFEGTEKVERVHYTNGEKGFIEVDKVISAIGQDHDNDSLKSVIKTGPDGNIIVNKKKQTIVPNVFAAGDCVHGPKTVIEAIATGRDAAKSILKYLDKIDEKKAEKEQSDLIKKDLAKHKTKEEHEKNKDNKDI